VTGVLLFDPKYTDPISIDGNTFANSTYGIRTSTFNNGTVVGLPISIEFTNNVEDVRARAAGVLVLTQSTVDGQGVARQYEGGDSPDNITGTPATTSSMATEATIRYGVEPATIN
jgi:hypothetical protein